jgi:hypothetical protein
MTMVPLGGLMSSAAGAPLSQSAGSETERAQKEALAHNRQVDATDKAERAAGIGQTEEDQESSERDADGRRLWEAPDKASKANKPQDETATGAAGPARQSKDATGQSGTQLDLTG